MVKNKGVELRPRPVKSVFVVRLHVPGYCDVAAV